MNRRLMIVDGNSLLYRAFYALPALSKNGVYTNAVYGFLRMFLGAWRVLLPEYAAVCFDKSKETFRMELFSDYKGTRKETPAELVPQFPLIRDVLRVLGIAQYELAGFEGDDLIGTLAAMYEKEIPVSIVTGDRDALQLVTERTTVLLTQHGTSDMAEMTPAAVLEKYHITPSQVVDMKALSGDASDNIPGIAGVGEKTAVKLLAAHGTLDGIYAAAEEISGKLGEKIRAGRETAYLSQKLATIRKDVPISAPLSDMNRPPHAEEAEALFARLGLSKLLPEFYAFERFAQAETSIKKEETDITVLPWSESVSLAGKTVALSASFSGTAPFYHVESAVLFDGEAAYAFPKEAATSLRQAERVLVLDAKKWYESDWDVAGVSFYDLSLAAYLADPVHAAYSRSVVAEIFDMAPGAEGLGEEGLAQEACFLSLAFPKAQEILAKKGMTTLLETIEAPLVPVLAAMEQAGIRTNEAAWQETLADMERRERLILKEIYTEAGEAFNVNSPKQLATILFEKLGLPAGKKTKSGYSTAADVLENLAADYPIVQSVLDYRSLSKLVSTYLEALPQLIRPETGRIHTSFNQTATATGRLSSSSPNLQNIPVRTEEGRKIRALFVPGDGYECFLSADYSQVELRVMAHMSGDDSMQESFRRGEDIHRRTAAEVLGIAPEDVTAEQRSHAKAVNFGIIYGISDFGLARQLGISKKAAADYIAAYFERYPGIQNFMKETVEKARETGHAVTLFGRVRELPDIGSKNFLRRSFAERMAMNTPIQGTAADIMKLAMIAVAGRLREGNFKSRILLQVHDELVLEAVESEIQALSAMLKEEMEGAAKLSVPLVVDIHTGKNWAEAK